MSIFSRFSHRRPRTQRSPSPTPPAGDAAVLDTVLPFNATLYQLGVELGVSQQPHEHTQAYGTRLRAEITARQFALERLLLRLTSKE